MKKLLQNRSVLAATFTVFFLCLAGAFAPLWLNQCTHRLTESEISILLQPLEQSQTSLVHIDYWSGNILWNQEVISAVVDWEEAAQGDPGIDVAYCRMDIILSGMSEAANRFLATYEKAMGKPVANLGFWELAAALRPMFTPDGWISESPAKERFENYVDAAIERTRL